MENEYDIAIVGMACRFPGAGNLEQFWTNLIEGVESISRLSDDELLEAGVSRACLVAGDYVKASPILASPGEFDAAFFDLTPLEAKTMDPQHRILLELAQEALDDAGCNSERFPGRIGVFTGAAMNTYFLHTGLGSRFQEDYIPTLIGNDKDFLSSRISYKFNLGGPSVTVQTACSTSLVAVHLARQSLLSGETDAAIAGGVSVRVPHRAGYFFVPGGVLSADGHVRAFDAKATGTVFGSGGGLVLLKRLADAVANGDQIYAVIKGSAVNNDGSQKAGYTAPSVDRQAEAVVEALSNAGVDPVTVNYVEAHGSGTPVGDPIELRALTKAFRAFTNRRGYCALGSVKTNVGHLDAAAGIAGLIKTALALRHRQVPPSLNFSEPNPEIDFAQTPFYVSTELKPWTCDGPRRAGVMATGIGGTNAHLVLEEAPTTNANTPTDSKKLLIISAKTETALTSATGRLRSFLERVGDSSLDDVAYTLQTGRRMFVHRAMLLAADSAEAIATLSEPGSKRIVSRQCPESERRSVVLLLPGVGDHYVGMAHGLYEKYETFRNEVNHCAEILQPSLGLDIRDLLYPKSGCWRQAGTGKGINLRQMLGRAAEAGPETTAFNRTLYAQPALFTIEFALARLWQSWGIKPDALVGHSMGEYVAACLAGVFSLEDALNLLVTRVKLVEELPTGAMLAIPLSEAELLPLLDQELSIGLINGPTLCVVAGSQPAVARLESLLQSKGVVCRPVQNAHPFHSKMLAPITRAFEDAVRKVQLRAPQVRFISNISGDWITAAEATNPTYWARHACETARFSDALRTMWQLENPVFLEAGPGRTLGVLAGQHPARRDGSRSVAISSLRHSYEQHPDCDFLLEAAGRLWLAGQQIDWEKLHAGADRRRLSLPAYPFERQEYWLKPATPPGASSGPTAALSKNPDFRQWFYVPSWKRHFPQSSERAIGPSIADKGMWLIFGDACGLAARMVARLEANGERFALVQPGSSFRQSGRHQFVIHPGAPEHYASLVRALAADEAIPDKIVHAWSLTDPVSDKWNLNDFARIQETGFYSLPFLFQALGRVNVTKKLELFTLSNHIQDVHGCEDLVPAKATVLGPCMVIPQEYPNVRVKSIDLDWPAPRVTGEQAVDAVLSEVRQPDAEVFIAYRHGQRWIQSYEPLALDRVCSTALTLREGGVYLITGGLGDIGLEIAIFLASRFRAKLLLVGRAVLPEPAARAEWLRQHSADDVTCQKIERLAEIEKREGEVTYVAADVANATAMRSAIAECHRRYGALHGVIHAAGIVGDKGAGEVGGIGAADCEPHFQAKAYGLMVLEEVLDARPLDFCLILSSLASILGGISQVAYAAANVFADAFVRQHNRRPSAVPWLSVNWDVWRLKQSQAEGALAGKTLEGLGLSSEEGCSILSQIVSVKAVPQIIVSTADLNARVRQWIRLDSLRSRIDLPTPDRGDPPTADRVQAGAEAAAEMSDTEQIIARIWEEALGIKKVQREDHFGEIGGHSLLAIKIVSELRRTFQLDLSVRVLFDSPTVGQLARFVEERILAEIESLTDEEAKQLAGDGSSSSIPG